MTMQTEILSPATGRLHVGATRPRRDDRVLPEVRVVAAVVALVLFVAWVILYLLPSRTGELFAWKITPEMTPMFMGAAYGAGAYYFLRVVLARRWHEVAHYFPGIAAFTWLLGIATVLHWEAFAGMPFSLECLLDPADFKGPPLAVYTWVILYFTTPLVVPLLWLRNRRTDPGTPDPEDRVVSERVRWGGALSGAALVVLGLGLFLFPTVVMPYWPWQLTPFTAQVVGAFLVAPGVALLGCAWDRRWSAWRILLQHEALAVGLILLAVLVQLGRPANLQAENPLTWLFVGAMVLFLGCFLALLFVMRDRRAQGSTGTPTAA
jgi:hypothetical protein